MIETAKKYLSCPVVVFGFIMGISVFSLASVLVAEYIFGLAPCILCIYQRIPFVAAILLALLGFILCKAQNGRGKILIPWVIGASGIAFLTNSVIAFYHTGVERHWWASHFEACAANPAASLEDIMNAPAVRCDEIPWADPIIGLSMANYNVLLCLGLAVVCLASMLLTKRSGR